MRFFSPRNLRFRLIAALCIAICPAIILGGYNLISQYNAAGERVRQETLRLVRAAESEYFRVVENARQLLVLLSHVPAVADQDVDACNELLADLKKRFPYFTNISTAEPGGERTASALPTTIRDSVADRAWYPRLLRSREFTIGEYRIGAISRKPNIDVAYPVNDKAGELKAIIFAGIDLSWFQDLAISLGLPEGWVLTVRDENGTILTRHPEGLKYVGKTIPEAPLLQAIRENHDNRKGMSISAGIDGIERIYAFTNLHHGHDTGSTYLSIGVPLSVAYADVNRDLLFWIVCHILVLFLAFLGMALGSHLFILPSVKTLTEATRELRAGNLSIRTGLPHTGGEFGELAGAFDRMAESLELQADERMRSREALLESERRFRTIFDSVNEAIMVLDPASGAILDANKRACEITGYKREQLKGFGPAELSSGVAPYTGETAMEWLEKTRTRGPQLFEWQGRSRTGRLFWTENNLRGAVIGGKDVVLLTARDISRRKRAEKALRESESRYRAFVANSSEGIFRMEIEEPIPVSPPNTEVIERLYASAYLAECNDEMARIHGLGSGTDLIGSRLSEFLPLSDPRNREYLTKFIQSGCRLAEAESYRKDVNGREICLSSSLVGVIEDDRLVRAWGVQREITRQKQAEEKLRNLYRFNQEIISSARNGILVYDLDFNYILWNRFMEEITGLPAASMVGKNALEEFPHMRKQGIDLLLEKAAAGETCRSGDIHFIVPHTQMEAWLIANYGPYYNTRGEIIGVIGIITDITGRKAAEAEVERMSRRNRLILDAAGDGIIGMDKGGRAIFVNPASAEMLGYEADQMIGEDVHHLIHHSTSDCSSYPASRCPVLKTLSNGAKCRIRDEVLWKKDGVSFPVVYSSTPIVEDGEITGAVMTFRDITERRKAEEAKGKLEEQLRQAQKMEAIGTLAGGIAHDFNNILTPIMGYCELCLQEVEKGSGLYKKIEQVLKSSIRAKDLVTQILTFSRKGDRELLPVRVSLMIKEALDFLRSSLPSTVVIRRRIDPETVSLKVLADPTRIHQIIINLCANAAHAMGEKGGTLDVALGSYDIGGGLDRRHPDLGPGKYLKLSVSDTGPGIDDKVLHRIFEPYFTTKPLGEGTGLGLAMVYGIVKSLGGDVSVTSEPGKGAVFDVVFPMAEVPDGNDVEVEQALPVGNGHILLVDDEPTVVDLQKEMVERLGYLATVKYGSLEAIKAFRANPKLFDLIITDQTMPHMTGLELAGEALKIRGDIPIILCTGFSEGIDEQRATAGGIKGFLMKPIPLREIASAISRVLEKGKKNKPWE